MSHCALVVEDTDDIANLMIAVLNKMDVESYHVTNGQAALEYLSKHTPDVMLLDIGLPGMSGWQILEAMKASPKGVSFPIIVLTAFSDTPNRLVGRLQDAVVQYITKPFMTETLAEAVQTVLKR